MHQRKRIYYSEPQKSLIWDRWRRGESLQQIADLFDRHHSAIAGVLARSGGIRPPPRRRSLRAFRPAEREEISRGVAAGKSIRSMAVALNRAPSTVSRELQRNQGRQRYRAAQADQAAWDRALRPKPCKLALHRVLASQVAVKLRRQWSPEQVAGWLGRMYPDDTSRQVSHETIYRTLYIQSRGALKKELLAHLRRTRTMRRSRHHTQKTENHGRIKDTAPISERPADAGDRAVPGCWEGDLVFEADRHADRAADTLRDPGEGCQQGQQDGSQRTDQERPSPGWPGSTTIDCSNPTAISRRPRPRQTTTGNSPVSQRP